MKFPGGTLVNCLTSHGTAGNQKYTVVGTEAIIEMDPAFAYEGLQMKIKKPQATEELKLPPSNQFARELDHIAMCITDNETPYTPGEEGLQDHRIMEAIYESAKTGKAVRLETIKKKDPFRGVKPTNE